MLKRIFQASSGAFRTRSPDRDHVTDERLVLAVATAIDAALKSFAYEHAGLKRRLDDVISIAAIVGGNEIEDIQAQSNPRADLLQKSDNEIRYGEERLHNLQNHIKSLQALRVDLEKRFPDVSIPHL
jgi:DNA polymerase III alpha subunit (gram-positive type)